MESDNLRFTDPATFTTELIARLTTPEKMEAFRYQEGLRNHGYMLELEKLIQVTGSVGLPRIIIALRHNGDAILTFRTGEPFRMVVLSKGLLLALKRPREELNDEELRILNEVYDLFNILI